MSFDQWKFQYTPPPTVSSPAPAANASSSSVLASAANPSETSNAGQLISQLQDLQDTNQYLQSVILSVSAGIGVEIDPSADPDTASALGALYPTQDLPKVITVAMYNRMLDAVMASNQLNSALGPTSAYEVNPLQTSAVMQVTKAVESSLLNSGQFTSQFPLLLRQLKGDSQVFTAMSEGLSQYPVLTSAGNTVSIDTQNKIAAATIDVSPDLNSFLNSVVNSFATSYSGVYKLAAQTSTVDADVNNVLTQFFLEPAVNLLQITSLLGSLQGFVHGPQLKNLVTGIAGSAYAQLVTDILPVRFLVDQFTQMATAPIKLITSNIGRMVSQINMAASIAEQVVNGVKGSFQHQSGPLKGLSYAYNCGMPHNSSIKVPSSGAAALQSPIPGIGQIEGGLAALAAHLDWATTKADQKAATVDTAMKKLLIRRNKDLNGQLDVLCSLQNLNALTSLAKSVISFAGTQAASGATQTVNQVQAVGLILSNLQTGTGASYSVSNGQIQATPPSVPAPASNVQKLLQNSGLNLITASSSGVSGASS